MKTKRKRLLSKDTAAVAVVRAGDTAYVTSELLWAGKAVRRVEVLSVVTLNEKSWALCRTSKWHRSAIVTELGSARPYWVDCALLSFSPYANGSHRASRARDTLRRVRC